VTITYDRSKRGRYQILGVAFLLVAALFVAVTVGVYRKAFTPVVTVTLQADRTGSQLFPGADVKVRGVRVGEVRRVAASASGATLTLALDPDDVALVPANVTARLLPKTLFGERYVDLRIPEAPAAPISGGAVITPDRSAATIEVEQVDEKLLPLLQAVRPDQVSVTLTALRQALDGRGVKLGQSLVGLDTYLKGINPSVPDLLRTLDELTPVADTYAAAAPDFFGGLADLTTATDTLADQREQLHRLLVGATDTAHDLSDYLDENADNLVKVADDARPTLELLARYSPEVPCFFRQLVEQIPPADISFGKGSTHPNVHQVRIGVAANRGKYLPGVDTPRYLDHRGPHCYSTSQPAPQYAPGGPLADGSRTAAPPREMPNPFDLSGWMGQTGHKQGGGR
jgi:virulence factor Mce-like protein